MEDLKEALLSLPHIQTVYFDEDGTWYWHKVQGIVSEKSRGEILADDAGGSEDESANTGKKK